MHVALVAVLGLSPVLPVAAEETAADGAAPPDAGRRGPMGRMVEELGLDEQQAASVREIMQEQRETMRAMRDKHKDAAETDREAARAEAQAHMAATREKLAGVLTPEQLDKFDSMSKEMRGRGGPGRHGPRGPDGRGKPHGPPPDAEEI